MDNHEEATDLLDTTMGALATDVTDLTPQSGKGVIDQWISTLSESENTKEVVALLQQLKTQLESGSPNPSELQQILVDLATHTHEMGVKVGPEGDMATRLEALGAALQTVAGQLTNV
ncbi:hypothetical protein [Fibrella forsythiae]|uniref:Uncharacterized protein n=1 Tax=Fibrella forsythiae TaxID=2817061 RepID=A0ABS3JJT4_9BACT|nr:hypothetical protein [Fibrella forsythiae]MBO0950272.1 hypothetical protein [Fibrella forsythiae]